MTVGASIFCLIVGAVLTFGIEQDSAEGVNLDNVGIIFMVAGVIGLITYYAVWAPRRRRLGTPVQVVEQPAVATPVVERRVYDA